MNKTNWLVFADWLDEHDDERSKLIRGLIGVKRTFESLEKLDPLWEIHSTSYFATLLGKSVALVNYALKFQKQRNVKLKLSNVAKALSLLNKRSDPKTKLKEINKLLLGSRVEPIATNMLDYINRPYLAALYIDLGDDNTTTVIYDLIGKKYLIMSFDDFQKKYRSEYSL